MLLDRDLRKPTIQEFNLLNFLIKKSSFFIKKDWEATLLVSSMNDEKMGSLHLFPNGKINIDTIFSHQVSEFQFMDIDDINVIVSLNIDNMGNLFELDVWKTDFSKLIKLPEINENIFLSY